MALQLSRSKRKKIAGTVNPIFGRALGPDVSGNYAGSKKSGLQPGGNQVSGGIAFASRLASSALTSPGYLKKAYPAGDIFGTGYNPKDPEHKRLLKESGFGVTENPSDFRKSRLKFEDKLIDYELDKEFGLLGTRQKTGVSSRSIRANRSRRRGAGGNIVSRRTLG